ncbi:MAG: GDSL-type esterase/lipase family protein [Cytophagaceae bacterium]|nr:GDSL-type esterase/lipase family protein [Cytophagaceae bacterium]MDW8457199.1 GDSL-type esterase/lipase family protein [Cytophagaceae bacterium]
MQSYGQYPINPEYSWLKPHLNYIQFYDKSAVEQICKYWNETATRRFTIVHVGDSHIQPDILTSKTRSILQTLLGDAGKGMVFPNCIAKTYSHFGNSCRYKGEWTYGKSLVLPPKVTLGVQGMACRTTDPHASFTISLSKEIIPHSYNSFKIFCKKVHSSFDLIIETNGHAVPVTIDATPEDSLPYVHVLLPSVANDITFKVTKRNPWEKEFEFYGVSIEKPESKGLLYHAMGVGGAKYNAISYEELYEPHLKALQPDVVIIDYGTNDILYKDTILAELETDIVAAIQKTRNAAPNASIILTSAQDMFWKQQFTKSSKKFSELIHRIAQQYNCGVYDWFWIAGGGFAMKKWEQYGLAQSDLIHLTVQGYTLKGQLLAEAFLNTLQELDKNFSIQSLVFARDTLSELPYDSSLFRTATPQQPLNRNYSPPSHQRVIKHKIRPGENLGTIARKYHVSVSQLKKWNNLKSDLIRAGKYLIIYRK